VAKLVAYGTAAAKPSLFGLGPIPVVRQALARAGWSNGDVGRVEINEAFEATALAVILGRPPDIVNVEGGAIARGRSDRRDKRPVFSIRYVETTFKRGVGGGRSPSRKMLQLQKALQFLKSTSRRGSLCLSPAIKRQRSLSVTDAAVLRT
jgi:hypothetical protein